MCAQYMIVDTAIAYQYRLYMIDDTVYMYTMIHVHGVHPLSLWTDDLMSAGDHVPY